MEKEISVVHLQLVRDRRIPYGEMRLNTPKKAAELMRDFLGEGDPDREHVIICCIDNCGKPTHIQVTGIGTVCACMISVPEIYKTAILSNASGLIMFHTHPSGEVKPSQNDVKATKKIKEAGKILDIPLQDHIILGADGSYFSFRESDSWDEPA